MKPELEPKTIDSFFLERLKKRGVEIYQESIRPLFDCALAATILRERENELTIDQRENMLSRLIDLCIGEFLYVKDFEGLRPLSSKDIEELSHRAVDKFFLFETEDLKSHNDSLPYYDATISTLRMTILDLEKINSPLSKKNFSVSLINDIFETTFRKIDGFAHMMMLGLYPDALAAWRTIHESRCFLTLLVNGGDKVRYAYIDHIYFSNAYGFKENFTKSQLDETFAELKERMEKHGLKSKDMKRFIDYGWLYQHPLYRPDDRLFKLNFRDGVERLAGFRTAIVDEVYTYTSEITHSSAIFYYINDEICRSLGLTYTYDVTIDIVRLYLSYMSDYFLHNQDRQQKIERDLSDLKSIYQRLNERYMKLNPEEEENQDDQTNE